MGRRVLGLLLLILLACGTPTKTEKKLFTIEVPYEISTLDPHERNTLSNFAVLSHFYEPLVTSDAGMKIQPCLAKLWENPDQLTWLFYLQTSVHFHSGKPLTSADVVYSFQRLLQHPELEMGGYLTDISDIRAVDRYTVRIHTLRPMN